MSKTPIADLRVPDGIDDRPIRSCRGLLGGRRRLEEPRAISGRTPGLPRTQDAEVTGQVFTFEIETSTGGNTGGVEIGIFGEGSPEHGGIPPAGLTHGTQIVVGATFGCWGGVGVLLPWPWQTY